MMSGDVAARARAVLAQLYSRTGFRGPVITLLSGSGVALVITYIAQVVLTRLYPPEAFGISDWFVMAMTILLAIGSLRYEDAVMTPADEREASQVLRLALTLTAVSATLLGVAAIWSGPIAASLGVSEVAPWLWLLPIALFLTKSTRLLEAWLARLKRFRPASAGHIASSGAMAGFRIGAGAMPGVAGAGGLIGGFVAGQIAAIAVLLPSVARLRRGTTGTGRARPSDSLRIPSESLLRIARRYRNYATYSMPAAALNAAFSRLPTLLLPLFFSWTVVGHYGRTFVALAVPLGLIGTAVAQVFFVHAGEARRSGRLGVLTGQVHGRLVMLGVLPTLSLMIAGPDLFQTVFGDAWRPAGEYMRYVAPWMFLTAVASPLTRIFDVLEKQKADLLTSAGMFVLQTVALVAGGRTGNVVLTLVLLGIVGSLARAAHVATILHLAHVPFKEGVAPYARYVGYAGVPLIAVAAAYLWMPPWVTLAVTVISHLAYYGFVAVREGMLIPPNARVQERQDEPSAP